MLFRSSPAEKAPQKQPFCPSAAFCGPGCAVLLRLFSNVAVSSGGGMTQRDPGDPKQRGCQSSQGPLEVVADDPPAGDAALGSDNQIQHVQPRFTPLMRGKQSLTACTFSFSGLRRLPCKASLAKPEGARIIKPRSGRAMGRSNPKQRKEPITQENRPRHPGRADAAEVVKRPDSHEGCTDSMVPSGHVFPAEAN